MYVLYILIYHISFFSIHWIEHVESAFFVGGVKPCNARGHVVSGYFRQPQVKVSTH
jgi:hypothetical protein